MNSQKIDHAAIEEQASLWAVRIDGRKLNHTDEAEFFVWLNESPKHIQAFQKFAKHQITLNKVVETTQKTNTRVKPARNSISKLTLSSHGWARQYVSFRRIAPLCVAIFAFMLLFAWQKKPLGSSHQINSSLVTYETEIGEQRTVNLEDGSTVTLNTQSILQVQYTSSERTLTLLSGEAYFNVTKDAKRPFIVNVSRRQIIAVGTEFSVDRSQESLEVIVTEGQVTLSSHHQEATALTQTNVVKTNLVSARTLVTAPKTMVLIGEGQKALLGANDALNISIINQQKLAQHLSWRQSMLIFDNDNLATVVEEMSRYSKNRIILSEPWLHELRVGGYFKAGDINALSQTIASQFNLVLQKQANGDLLLMKKTST